MVATSILVMCEPTVLSRRGWKHIKTRHNYPVFQAFREETQTRQGLSSVLLPPNCLTKRIHFQMSTPVVIKTAAVRPII
jgi:hypothetical protein